LQGEKMAEDNDTTEATETDIFKQQEKTIELLYDVLQAKIGQQPAISYVQPAATEKRPLNYIAWIAGGLIFFYFFVMQRKG